MQEDNIDIEKLRKFNRSFIFKFNGRLKPANVYGSEYLVDKILSIIVPTNKEFDLTPKQFIPVWCFLIGLLINKMDDGSDYNLSKEYYKYYPNLCSNRLAINLLRKILLQNPVLSNLGNTKRSIDKIMTTGANSCNVILKSIISNESIPLPTFPLEEEMDICLMINAVMNQLTRHKKIFFAKYASHPPDGIKDRVTGRIDLALLDANLKYATNVYQFLTNVGEYMDVFMNYKYNPNRRYQSLGTVE